MPAGKYDFTIEQGASYVDTFTWRVDDGSNPPIGPIVNVAGCTARMDIRQSLTSNQIILTLTTENGRIILTPGDVVDNIKINLNASTTMGLSFDTAVYDLEIAVTATSFVTRLLKGIVTLDKEVTRSA